MAKKNNNNLVILALAGAGIYLLSRPKQQAPPYPPPYQQYPQVPPAPQQNTPQWQSWANAIISVYGAVSQLWAPGGPFYQQPITQEQAAQIQQNIDIFAQTQPWP